MILSAAEKNRLKQKYGPWAVVTGASSGIGLELAERLAESGINLILNARTTADLETAKDKITAVHPVEIKLVAADLAKLENVDQLLAEIKDVNVGLFIASAGFGTSGLFMNAVLADELAMMHVNCDALMALTLHFSQRFAQKKRGGIILLSSMVAFQGVPFAANYSATKAYVQSLAEAIAVELKPYGVDVLAAAPGPVASGFAKRADMVMSMSLTPAEVGIPILKALGRQSTVLPGFLTKLLVGSLRTVPRWGKVQIMKLVMGGMTKHQPNVL